MVQLKETSFGIHQNAPVRMFTWTTNKGISVTAISYGAIITSIKVPDNKNDIKDIVLGFDDLEKYINQNEPHFGAIIGRCANRIGGAQFEIDGEEYQLAKNIGNDHLHGGLLGFDKYNWQTSVSGNKVTFSYYSKDLEEGYPGDLITNVTYELTEDGTLHQDIIATSTKKTVVNLTNHSYFNLAGHDAGVDELYDHYVFINADKITETNNKSIPTGKFINVKDTLFDLRSPVKLGDVMNKDSKLFDDNFCVNIDNRKANNLVARVTHPKSGRVLEVYSNQPGVQLYTSNFLPPPTETAIVGKNGVGYRRHGAFCLETQNYPDAVHHDNFPNAILVPGQVYKHSVKFCFGYASPGK